MLIFHHCDYCLREMIQKQGFTLACGFSPLLVGFLGSGPLVRLNVLEKDVLDRAAHLTMARKQVQGQEEALQRLPPFL